MNSKIVGTIAYVAIICAGIAVNGFVFTVLWGWFIVPVFAVPVVTVTQAIGVSVFVAFVRNKRFSEPDDKRAFSPEWWAFVISESLFRPVWVLIISVVVYFFVR